MRADMLDTLLGLVARRVNLFQDGWGDRTTLERLAGTGLRFAPPVAADVRWDGQTSLGGFVLRRGRFEAPDGPGELPLPAACRQARVELLLPPGATDETPVCLHFAATGDEGLARRRWAMALPLARRGIGALLLENAFYGGRRPPGQRGFRLRHVSDLWAMCAATIREGLALVRWLCEERRGPVGVTGVSMGGSMAAAVAAFSGAPLAVVPCITPHSGAAVFAEGLLARSCAWPVLDAELGCGSGGALVRLRELLAMTDLRLLPPPVRPDAAILVAARRDGCVPAWSVELLHRHWRGAALRWVPGGHTGAFLFHRRAFQDAVADAFEALAGPAQPTPMRPAPRPRTRLR